MSMDFNPNNNIVQLCLLGMGMEGNDQPDEAGKLFDRAWKQATHPFEKFIAAYFVARHQREVRDQLTWFETSLQFASEVPPETVPGVLPSLYSTIAQCRERLHDDVNAQRFRALAVSFPTTPTDKGPFYHGTKADLRVGDLLTPGNRSNYNADLVMHHVYFTALIHGAGLAAALAGGDGRERVYLVEPTGSFEHDPNVTDKKFPGNLTRSYRSRSELKIVGEITDWSKQTPEELEEWRAKVARTTGKIIN